MKDIRLFILPLVTFLFLMVMLVVFAPKVNANPLSEADISCLTENIYHEARGESILGQVWVAKSVLERKADTRWPNTICEVVYQPKQYSWTSDERKPISDELAWKFAEEVAVAALQGRIDVPELNHYLRCDIMDRPNTWWWKKMDFVGQVGNHCFFNDPK